MASGSETSDEDEAVWQTVSDNKKTTKRRLIESPEKFKHKSKSMRNANSNNNSDLPTTSNNQFDILDDNMNEDNDDDANNNNDESDDNVNKTSNEPKPPPIIIPDVSNIKAMITNFSKLINTEDFSYKSMRDGQVRLMTKNIQSYRAIVKYLDDKKILFHTYQLKQERAYRVVVKNLHFSTSILAIKEEIQSLGHQVRNVMNIKSRVTKQPMSMFYVDLEPNNNNKMIYEVRYLLNAVVKIEPPLKINDIVQCYRCQQFGHSKTYCRKRFNCVKCGLNHPTDNCPKPDNTPPQCVNCMEHHTANYKGCEVYKEILKKKNAYRRQNRNAPEPRSSGFTPFNNNNSSNNFNGNQYSYAQAVKNNNNSQESSILKSLEMFFQKQNELTNQLLNMMQLIITKLCV